MLNIPYVTSVAAVSTVVTKELVVDTAQTISVLSGDGTLLKNGAAQSSPCYFSVGDKLQVQVVAGLSGHTVFVVLGSDIDYDQSVVAVTAADSIDYKVYPYLKNLRAVDIIEDNNGIGFIPNTEEDRLIVGYDMPNVYALDLPDSAPYTAGSWLLLTDCLGYRVRLFNINGQCCYERDFDAPPVGPWCAWGNKFAVCLPADDSVLLLTLGSTITEKVVTDFIHPVSASQSNTKTWVAHLNGVSCYSSGIDFTINMPNVRELLAVSDDMCFVTTSDGHYGFVTSAGYTQIGDAYVRAMCLHNGSILFAEGQTLHLINTSGVETAAYEFDDESFPASVASCGSEIYVGRFGHNSDTLLNSDLTFKSSSSVMYNSPYGVAYIGSTPVVAALYVNRPPVLYTVDKLVTGFDLTDAESAPRNTLVTTSSITVSGIESGFPVQASVPDILGATITKNGLSVGQSTTVVKNDIVSVSITTPVLPSVGIKVPLFMGQVYDDLSSETAVYDVTPDEFSFTDQLGVAAGSAHTSEEVTISGVDADAGAIVSVSAGTLYKNGSAVAQSWVGVVNGDKIKVSVTAPAQNNQALIVIIASGAYRTDWAITTPSADQYYIDKSLVSVDEQSWPSSGMDTANSLVAVPIDMSGLTRIDLSGTPTGDTYSGEAVALLTDVTSHKLYEVNTALLTLQQALSVPGIVGSFAVNAGLYGDVSLFALTSSSIQGFDSDYNSLWDPVDTGYTDIVDAIGVSNGTSVFIAHADGSVTHHTFNYATGELTAADATYSLGAKRFLHTVINKVEYAFAYGDKIAQVFPSVGSSIEQKCNTLAFNGTLIYTADRLANEVRSYGVGGSLTQAVKMPFAVGDLVMCGSILAAADLSGHRVVRLDGAFKEAGSVNLTAGPVDLTATATTVYAYERRSNLASTCVAKDLPEVTGVAPYVDAVLGTPIVSTLTLKNAMRDVVPVVGSAIISSDLPNGNFTASVTASAYNYTELVSKFAVGSTVYSIPVKTVAKLTPNVLYFSRQYDAVVSTEVDSEAQTITGLTDGVSTTLSIDQGSTTVELVVNGIVTGSYAEVKNGDKVSIRVLAEGPFGSTHRYHLYANNVNVGVFTVACVLLGDAVKFPGMNVRRTRLYPNRVLPTVGEIGLYSPSVLPVTVNQVETGEADVLDTHSELSSTQPISIPSLSRSAEQASAELESYSVRQYAMPSESVLSSKRCYGGMPKADRLSAHEVTSSDSEFFVQPRSFGLNSKQTPFFLRPHMFLSSTKRLSSEHYPEHHSEAVLKSYLRLAQRLSEADLLGWRYTPTHSESVLAVCGRSEFNWNYGAAEWTRPEHETHVTDMLYAPADPTQQYLVNTDWASYGRRIELGAADFAKGYVHREEFDRGQTTYSIHRELFSAYPVHGPQVPEGRYSAAGRRAPSTSQALFSAKAKRGLGQSVSSIPAQWVHVVSSYHAFAEHLGSRLSYTSRYAALQAGTPLVSNLRVFKALQHLVIADPVWIEPVLPSAESKGLFPSALMAEADAQSNAKHKYRAVEFKGYYFWNEDVEVMTKTCYSFGSMSRSPYKWNMQLRNCWAAAKQSGYMGGG